MADPIARLTASIRALILELFPNTHFYGVYRYAVTACDYDAQTIDALPASARPGLPALAAIPIRSPIKVDVQPDTTVAIGFLDGDPTQPYVVTLDQATVLSRAKIRAEGVIELGELATMNVARQGDLNVIPMLGVSVMFSESPTGGIPLPMMSNTPYFIAVGSVLTVPPTVPNFVTPGQFIGFTSSGSQLTKTQ